MGERYEVTTYGTGDRFGVLDTTKPRDDDTRIIVTCDREVGATLVVEELNKLQHQVEEKPLNLHDDFQEWESRIKWIDKTTRRLVEIEEIYLLESQRIINEAQANHVDFKAIYGANNKDVRQQYADEQLADLLEEKKELEFLKANDNRRISFLKRIIDLKINLIKYNNTDIELPK